MTGNLAEGETMSTTNGKSYQSLEGTVDAVNAKGAAPGG